MLFDHDLTPSQLRNLEGMLPCLVMDRTQLILDIFARHARTREGQLQVELAQLEYMLPRLTGRGKAMSQLGGGIGTRGPGETQAGDGPAAHSKAARPPEGRAGDGASRYGASSGRGGKRCRCRRWRWWGIRTRGRARCSIALTGAGVLESSRMFATLDPKLRAVELPSGGEGAVVGYGGVYPQSAAYAGDQLSRHAGRGGAGGAAAARARRF